MKLQRLTDLASRMVLGMLLAGWVVMLSGCVRMAVLPKADESITGAMSQPRQVDKLKVPLERDPTKVYRIGARDAIRVDVRKDPSLSQTYFVTEEGNILLPNIGPLQVANLTTQEIQTRLNGILAQYIREPEVKVGVQDYRSKTISVVGQVRNQGPQIMRADMLTLQEAIFNAGLITPEAAPQRTQVITPDPENPVVRQIDLSDIIYKGKMRENILLKPGDIVYVPARYSVNLAAASTTCFVPPTNRSTCITACNMQITTTMTTTIIIMDTATRTTRRSSPPPPRPQSKVMTGAARGVNWENKKVRKEA